MPVSSYERNRSCYQGGSVLRHNEETDLTPVMIMAFGRPAEPLERNREDFRRMELKKMIRLHGTFGKVQRKLLEAARLAPSAMEFTAMAFCGDGKQGTFVCE